MLPVVVKYASGAADEDKLNALIADAWRAILEDPKERAEIVALLDVDDAKLDPDIPPFLAEVKKSGTFGAEVLIALAGGFIVGFATGFGKNMGEKVGEKTAEVLRDLWNDYFRNRVNPPGKGELGPEKKKIIDEE